MVDPGDETSAHEPPHSIEVLILGPLDVRRGGAPIALPGRRHGQLLVDLVLHLGRRVSTETLVDHLWDESPPATATKTVHKYISELRRALGAGVDGFLATSGTGYVLDLPAEAVDAARFDELVASARTQPDADAVETLRDAESLWRGRALDRFADLEFALPTAQRLEEHRLLAMERRLGLLLALGRHAEVLAELEQLTIEHPLREELHAHLMLARAMAGRRAAALEAYQRIRRRLAEDLGIDPSSRLREVEQRILVGDLQDVATTPPPVGVAGRVPNPISSFVGRAVLLDRVADALADGRLVTLTGPGGSGKTRVAIEAARRRADRSGDQACFVDLSVIDEADLLIGAVTTAVGLPDQPGTETTQLLREALGSRTTLLILDNCEHLSRAVAGLATDLLGACADLTILVTSREPLGIPGEQVRPVPALDLPDDDAEPAESEAVQLFAARARDADPSFDLGDEHELRQVVDICARLDGMPLALELAAAHIPAMTLADLTGRLADRFQLLDSGGAGPGRQSTLRATIDWSHALLSPDERLFFERLSLFPGTFDLDAATAVGAVDPLDHAAAAGVLSSLVRRSMVARVGDVGNTARYRLLDTLRAYGRELLVDRPDDAVVQRTHALHFARRVASADGRASADDRWHLELTVEHHNLQAALQRSIDEDPGLAADMVYELERYWTRTDQVVEGLRHVERLVAADDLDDRRRAQALCCAAELRTEHGEATLAEGEASAALAIFTNLGDELGAMRASSALGRAIGNGGRYAEALERMGAARRWFAGGDPARWAADGLSVGHLLLAQGDSGQAEQVFGEIWEWGDRRGMEFVAAKALWLLGVVARHRGEWDEAGARCRRAFDAFAALGDRSALAHVRMTLGDIARLAGDRAGAQVLYTEAFEALHDIGDRRCVASAMKNLGDLARDDDAGTAAAMYLQCLDRRDALGDRAGAAEALEGLAAALLDMDRAPAAATLLAHADAIRADTRSMAPAVERPGIASMHERLAALLSPDDLDEAFAAGARMSLGDSVRLAHRTAMVDGVT